MTNLRTISETGTAKLPEVMAALKAYYLAPSQPPFSVCYRFVLRDAEENGWGPIPSMSSLRHRMVQEIRRGQP